MPEDRVEHIRAARPVEPASLNPAANPIGLRPEVRHLRKGNPGEGRALKIDDDAPAGIVEGADLDALLVLSIVIALGSVPALQAVERRHYPTLRVAKGPPIQSLPESSIVRVAGVTVLRNPGPWAEIACHWRGEALGRFLLGPTPGETVTREDRVVAVTLVNMVSARVHEERHARG